MPRMLDSIEQAKYEIADKMKLARSITDVTGDIIDHLMKEPEMQALLFYMARSLKGAMVQLKVADDINQDKAGITQKDVAKAHLEELERITKPFRKYIPEY